MARNKTFLIKLSAEEKNGLWVVALHHGMDMSKVLRMLVQRERDAIEKLGRVEDSAEHRRAVDDEEERQEWFAERRLLESGGER